MASRYAIATNKTRRSLDGETIEHKVNKRKMRQFDSSNYTGIPAYLMDFGFGGFLGYGKTMPVSVALDEELTREVRRKT